MKSVKFLSCFCLGIVAWIGSAFGAENCNFRRGDVNGDNVVNLTDVIVLNGYLGNTNITSTSNTLRLRAADVDNDNDVDGQDVVFLQDFLFSGGPQPPPPFAVAGLDPDCTVFIRGDANGDGRVNSLDPQRIVDHIFFMNPLCVLASGDANGDGGGLDSSDAAFVIDFLQGQNAGMKAPFPRAGILCDCP